MIYLRMLWNFGNFVEWEKPTHAWDLWSDPLQILAALMPLSYSSNGIGICIGIGVSISSSIGIGFIIGMGINIGNLMNEMNTTNKTN